MRDMPLGPLMVDVAGMELCREDIELLQSPAIGGVILFGRNYESPEQVSALNEEIRSLRSPALLVSVDQEGGRVQRFRNGFTRLPPMAQFGQLFDDDPVLATELATAAGLVMATELVRVGVDFSFAPVLDCEMTDSEAIGDRAIHHDPAVISAIAAAFAQGMNKAGMGATGKHFPGHGGVTADSHFTLPLDQRSLAELEQRDLVPFRNLVGNLHGVLTTHVAFPAINDMPPTFSHWWLSNYLRKEIGFKGVIFTDDLSMKATHELGDVVQRSRRALEAGCDMALVCNDREKASRVVHEIGNSMPANQSLLSTMYATRKAIAESGQYGESLEILACQPDLIQRAVAAAVPA